MLALELNSAARTLMSAATTLSRGASSAGSLSDEAVAVVHQQLTVGALAVRELGGPYFARKGEAIFQSALKLDPTSPNSVNAAINAAMDGATSLLTRATYR